MEKENRFENRTIILLNGESQDYILDNSSKAKIAITKRKDLKIYVNQDFETLSKEEQLVVMYHELGHSKFKLWKLYLNIIEVLCFLSEPLIFFSLLLLLTNFIFRIQIFNVANFVWLISLIIGLFLFFIMVLFYWVLEILADLNSISRIDKKYLINVIKKEYSGKKRSLWDKYITHPPWKLRKKIMEKFT